MKWYDRCKQDDIKSKYLESAVHSKRKNQHQNHENKKRFPFELYILKKILSSPKPQVKSGLKQAKYQLNFSSVKDLATSYVCVCGWVSLRANDHVYRAEWTTIEFHMNAMNDLQPFSIFWSAYCDHRPLFSDDKYRMWLRLLSKFLWNRKKKTMKYHTNWSFCKLDHLRCIFTEWLFWPWKTVSSDLILANKELRRYESGWQQEKTWLEQKKKRIEINICTYISAVIFWSENTSMPMEWAATSATPNAVVSFVFDRTASKKKNGDKKNIYYDNIGKKKRFYYNWYAISTVSVTIVIHLMENITYKLVIHWDQLATAWADYFWLSGHQHTVSEAVNSIPTQMLPKYHAFGNKSIPMRHELSDFLLKKRSNHKLFCCKKI